MPAEQQPIGRKRRFKQKLAWFLCLGAALFTAVIIPLYFLIPILGDAAIHTIWSIIAFLFWFLAICLLIVAMIEAPVAAIAAFVFSIIWKPRYPALARIISLLLLGAAIFCDVMILMWVF